MLYPQHNHRRIAQKLDGIWQFCRDSEDLGERQCWFKNPLESTMPMPVPAAFNEMTSDPELRDPCGIVWYFLRFQTKLSESHPCARIRFGAAAPKARIFLNGRLIADEHLGKLPFDADASVHLKDGENLLAVRIDTRLDWSHLPPGFLKEENADWSGKFLRGSQTPRHEYHFDFLHSGGLLRSVWLIQLPSCHLETLRVRTLLDAEENPHGFRVEPKLSLDSDTAVCCRLFNADGSLAAEGIGTKFLDLKPIEPRLWSPDLPHLYRLQVEIDGVDYYEESLGLRHVKVTPDAFLLNGEPVYLAGFGMHEDLPLIGQGHSDARIVKDLTRLKEMGGNSFRTSHYPYDESAYRLADQLGLLVIAESAAVGMNAWNAYEVFHEDRINAETLAHHKRIMERMIDRDHRHPSVIMWSLANEVACYEPKAKSYFEALFNFCRNISPDPLPLTVVQSSVPPSFAEKQSQTAQFCDVVCWNRYYSWYQDCGHLEDILPQIREEIQAWRRAFPDKPVMLTEFGADALAGLHHHPPIMFSEEYQVRLIETFLQGVDEFPFVVGEHVWNMADFATKQGVTRIGGNLKGVHTRNRQPKLAAHFLQQRWQGFPKNSTAKRPAS